MCFDIPHSSLIAYNTKDMILKTVCTHLFKSCRVGWEWAECKTYLSQSPTTECQGGSELETARARKWTLLSRNTVQATAYSRKVLSQTGCVVVLCYVEKYLDCLQVVEALITRPHVMADNSINCPAHTQTKMTAFSSEPQYLIPVKSTSFSDQKIWKCTNIICALCNEHKKSTCSIVICKRFLGCLQFSGKFHILQ